MYKKSSTSGNCPYFQPNYLKLRISLGKMASSENSFKREISSRRTRVKNGTFFAEKINTMCFRFTVKQFLTTATITVRSCFHFLRCILPYGDHFPRKSETRLQNKCFLLRVGLHRTRGGQGGGPRLADIFFPILPENLTSHPVRKTKIFSCERQKKN